METHQQVYAQVMYHSYFTWIGQLVTSYCIQYSVLAVVLPVYYFMAWVQIHKQFYDMSYDIIRHMTIVWQNQ